MDRRLTGLLLVLAVLVAAVGLPALIGKPVPGSPVSEVIDAPPAVGSCVGTLTYPATPAPARTAGPFDQGAAGRRPVAGIVPCTGRVLGQVIQVTGQSGGGPAAGPELVPDSCRSRVEPFVGAAFSTSILGLDWHPSIEVDATLVGPDAHDRAAGRTWTACVMAAVDQTFPATSLRGSWTAHTLPAAFGLCWAAGVIQHGAPTSCAAPHRTQQLGYAALPAAGGAWAGSSAAAPVRTGCAALAATVLNSADPTRGGVLTVSVLADADGAPYVQCVVTATGGRLLRGSLIGIGSAPVPLA